MSAIYFWSQFSYKCLQVTVITGGPKLVPCPEDDDFMTSFDKMMAESITTRSNEALKVPPVDIAVPMHLKGQKKGKHDMQLGGIIRLHNIL